MKIYRLTLHNFGIYAGTNSLEFHSNKPVILIGGMNGRGKTTILEAILIALYGRRSFAVTEAKMSFPKYLERLLNTTDKTHEAFIELEFGQSVENDSNTYIIRREWNTKKKTLDFNTVAIFNGIYDQFLSENWDLFIEETLPSAIAPFFFFDGEKIAELASTDGDSKIKDSIKALLGIDVIEQAILDIEKVIDKSKKAVKTNAKLREINALEQEKNHLYSAVKEAHDKLADLREKKSRAAKKLAHAKDTFAAKGGHFTSTKDDLETEIERINQELEASNAKVQEIIAGDIPLMLVMPLLNIILMQSEQEMEQKGIQTALSKLPELFQAFGKKNDNNFQVEEFMNFVRHNTGNVKEIYNLTDSGIFRLRELCADMPTNLSERARSVLLERQRLFKRKDEIENYLSINVDEKQTNKQYSNILKFTAELATLEEKYRVAKQNLEERESALDRAVRKHRIAIENAIEGMEGIEDTKRKVKYARYSIDVLNEYKVRLQQSKTEVLAKTMTTCFLKIATKQNLIAKVLIDPDTLVFSYYNENEQPINRASLSAGEKQLLVIAMLWALGICSRKQLPVIIDTPLARLDSAHRDTLILNYFPKASSQIILLSTDSEIYGSHYERLKPFVGKEYTLVYHDDNQRTTISAGYFERVIS